MRLRLGCGIAACSRDTSPYRWWRHCPLQCAEEPSLHLWLGHCCCCCCCCLRENESFSLGKRERPQRERERERSSRSRVTLFPPSSFPSIRKCVTPLCVAHTKTQPHAPSSKYICIYARTRLFCFCLFSRHQASSPFSFFLCTRPFPFVYFFFFLSWLPNLCPSSTPLRRLVLLLRCHLSSFSLSLSLSVGVRVCLLRPPPSFTVSLALSSTLCSTERALNENLNHFNELLKIQQDREKELLKIQQDREREGATQNPTTTREMSRH